MSVKRQRLVDEQDREEFVSLDDSTDDNDDADLVLRMKRDIWDSRLHSKIFKNIKCKFSCKFEKTKTIKVMVYYTSVYTLYKLYIWC